MSYPQGNQAPGKTSYKPQFFENTRKGEVKELKQLLKSVVNSKDVQKRRDVIKKVIAFTTLGIDVSELFAEMCLASYSSDLIQKKMIYQFLTTYGEQNGELGLMAINTFIKDCKDADKHVRGLAIRHLCGLRFEGIQEHMVTQIKEGLRDGEPYVRKTAIMGVIKLFYLDRQLLLSQDIIEELYEMIKDPSHVVVMNAMLVLNEVLAEESGIQVTSKMVIYLLNRIKEFNEWGQTVVLETTSKYQVQSDEEMLDIMNLLDDRLKHSCPAIVLGTMKVFLNYAKTDPELADQVYGRIKDPLLTLLLATEVGGAFESMYSVLQHILFIVAKAASHFRGDYKIFYCREDEPTYIKNTKIKILTNLAATENLGNILNELGEYVGQEGLSRQAVEGLGQVAQQMEDMAIPILKQLTMYLSSSYDCEGAVLNSVIKEYRNILLQYPHLHDKVPFDQEISTITEVPSKIAFVELMGEFGIHIDHASYTLEQYVDQYISQQHQQQDKTESPSDLQLYHLRLLTMCVKLFVKKPAEMQSVLGKLFMAIFENEQEDIDLKERAAFYYHALKTGIQELCAVLQVTVKNEQDLAQYSDSLEFNTLSIIYRQPPSKFIRSHDYFMKLRNKENEEEKGQQLQDNEEKEEREAKEEEKEEEKEQEKEKEQPVEQSDNLLELDFEPEMKELMPQDLLKDVEIEEEAFQEEWGDIEDGVSKTRSLRRASLVFGESQLEEKLKIYRVYCLAEGEQDDEYKSYNYSQYLDDQFVLSEVTANRDMGTVTLVVKSRSDELSAFYAKYLERALEQSGLV